MPWFFLPRFPPQSICATANKADQSSLEAVFQATRAVQAGCNNVSLLWTRLRDLRAYCSLYCSKPGPRLQRCISRLGGRMWLSFYFCLIFYNGFCCLIIASLKPAHFLSPRLQVKLSNAESTVRNVLNGGTTDAWVLSQAVLSAISLGLNFDHADVLGKLKTVLDGEYTLKGAGLLLTAASALNVEAAQLKPFVDAIEDIIGQAEVAGDVLSVWNERVRELAMMFRSPYLRLYFCLYFW